MEQTVLWRPILRVIVRLAAFFCLQRISWAAALLRFWDFANQNLKKRRDKPMWKNNDNNGADESNILHRQFTVYLATAVRRTKIQYLRSKYKLQRYEIPLEIEDTQTLPIFQSEPDIILSLPLLDQLGNIKLQRALEQAKKRDLYIFLAKVLEGRSFVEIAAELGIEYNTATAAYYRMLNRLRKELGGEDE